MSKDPKEQPKPKKLKLKKVTLRDLTVEQDVNVKGGAATWDCASNYQAASACGCPKTSA